MSIPNEHSPAFPCNWMDFQPGTGNQVIREQEFGLTKREYAAIKIMAGIASSDLPKTVGQVQYMAESAVVLADALLAQLSK